MTLTLILIIFWVAIACLGDVFFKRAASFLDPNYIWGVLLYGLTTIFAVFVFRRAQFGGVAVIWVAISLLISLAVSALYYHEPFSHTRVIASVLALTAVILAGGQ